MFLEIISPLSPVKSINQSVYWNTFHAVAILVSCQNMMHNGTHTMHNTQCKISLKHTQIGTYLHFWKTKRHGNSCDAMVGHSAVRAFSKAVMAVVVRTIGGRRFHAAAARYEKNR